MSKRSARRRPARRRTPLNLGGPHTVTFYVVRFMAQLPAELREGTEAPEWIKRESPPTLSEDAAWDAYQAVIDGLMTQRSGVRSPQLVIRTVTESVLRDYDTESDLDGVAENLDAVTSVLS